MKKTMLGSSMPFMLSSVMDCEFKAVSPAGTALKARRLIGSGIDLLVLLDSVDPSVERLPP